MKSSKPFPYRVRGVIKLYDGAYKYQAIIKVNDKTVDRRLYDVKLFAKHWVRRQVELRSKYPEGELYVYEQN